MRRRWMLWKFYRLLDIESILWTATDWARSRRMQLADAITKQPEYISAREQEKTNDQDTTSPR